MQSRFPLPWRPLAAVLLSGLLAAWPAAAKVDVEFVNPDRFTDIDNRGPWGTLKPGEVMDIVNRHLVALGQRCLAPDQTLVVRVTDMKLAGQLGGDRGWMRIPDARVMRDVDWPRIDLSWQLEDAQGAVIAGKSESVSDMDYLHHAIPVHDDNSTLPHERRMLTGWFDRNFCRR